MNIEELIRHLKKYPKDMPVMTWRHDAWLEKISIRVQKVAAKSWNDSEFNQVEDNKKYEFEALIIETHKESC